MNIRLAYRSALFVTVVLLSAARTGAASAAEPSTVVSAVGGTQGRWVVRAESSLVGMRDNWLSIPLPELGLTVGRDLAPRVSVELTGSAREAEDDRRRSWSALAAVRWIALASGNGRHALTLAAGPLLEIDNAVHGTLPFAHAEVAYVYRAPFGLTVLAGLGPNIALASSSYVTPPDPCEGANQGGHNFDFCLDLGPDAQEIHEGDRNAHLRFAVGWQF